MIGLCLFPSVINVSSGTFATGNIIKGQTSGVRAKLIDFNGDASTSYFYYLQKNVSFTAGETIVDETSNAIATLTSIGTSSPETQLHTYIGDHGESNVYIQAYITNDHQLYGFPRIIFYSCLYMLVYIPAYISIYPC